MHRIFTGVTNCSDGTNIILKILSSVKKLKEHLFCEESVISDNATRSKQYTMNKEELNKVKDDIVESFNAKIVKGKTEIYKVNRRNIQCENLTKFPYLCSHFQYSICRIDRV